MKLSRRRMTCPILLGAALLSVAASLTAPTKGDDAAPPATPSAGPTSSLSATPPAPRWPQPAPPSPSDVADAENFVHGVFKEAFAPTPSSQPDGAGRERDAGFARRFLVQGALAEADPAERFVLLRSARDFAARGGDTATAMHATRRLTSLFSLTPLETRESALSTLTDAAESAASTEAVQDNARALHQLIESALAVGDFDLAARAVAVAKPAAERSKDRMLQNLLREVSTDSDLLNGLEAEAAAAKRAMEQLRTDPADAKANGVAGAFLCFDRGDWQSGLPLLAKSSEAEWKDLAAKEAEATGTTTDAITDAATNSATTAGIAGAPAAAASALADAWRQSADAHPGRIREAARRRSAHWSLQALPKLSGLPRDAAQSRLDDLRTSVLRPGLLADLYDGENFERHRGVRIDPTIDFNWALGSPDARLGTNHFSLCWQGFIKAPEFGKYEIEAEADDGVIVRLEGLHVIDEWHTFHPQHYHTAVELTGNPQAFEVMYYEVSGAAYVHLTWKPPGAEKFVPIPPAAFSHDPVWPWGPTALATRARRADAERTVSADGAPTWFRKFADTLPWHAAQRHCEQQSGHLAWVRRPEDNDTLKRIAKGWSVWLGASDDEIENHWEWTNGRRLDPDLFDWWEGEPNGGRNENYLSILEGKGWNDSAGKMPFICQWEK